MEALQGAAADDASAAPADRGLQESGDELLESYKAEAIQKAIRSGRYSDSDKQVLAAMFEHIQRAELPPSGPAPADNSNGSSSRWVHVLAELPPAEPGWHWLWLRPPKPTAAKGSAEADAADGGSGTGGGSRTRRAASSEGPARSLTGYTASTPISLGGGRYVLWLRRPITEGPLAGWGFRLWVCAAEVQQQQQQGQQQGQGHWLGQRSVPGNVQMQLEALSSEHLESLPGHILLPPEFAPALDDLPSFGSIDWEAADDVLRLDPAQPAAAAAAAAAPGSSPLSPFHPSHSIVHTMFFPAKSAGSKAGSSAAAAARPGKLLSVDMSVGWCVLEPMPVKPKAQPAGAGGSTPAAAAEPVSRHKRSRPSSSEPGSLRPGPTGSSSEAAAAAAAATAAAMQPTVAAGVPLMRSTAGGMEALASVAAAAAATNGTYARPAAAMGMPHSSATGIFPAAVAAATAAASALVPAAAGSAHAGAAAGHVSTHNPLAALTSQLQRLQLLQLGPHKVLAVFQPPTTAAAADAAVATCRQLADPACAAALRHQLLQEDVRDKQQRNVPLAATHRRPLPGLAALGEPDNLQQQLLDFLLHDAALLAKLQGQANNNGSTPLLLAATWAQPGVYDRLLAVATADVLWTFTNTGWSPLHRLAQSAADLPPSAAEERGRFEQCIRSTIDRLVEVELQEAAAAPAEQRQQAINTALQCVVEYVSAAPAPSRHYRGQDVLLSMNIAQLAKQKFAQQVQ